MNIRFTSIIIITYIFSRNVSGIAAKGLSRKGFLFSYVAIYFVTFICNCFFRASDSNKVFVA